MSPDQPNAMLLAWEDGCTASPGERGLILLRLAEPQASDAERSAFTVGQRDAALLRLHERLFGGTAQALADCPACAEQLELDVPLAGIRVDPGGAVPARFELEHAGRVLAFRLPNAADLADLGAEGQSGYELARLCLLEPGAAGTGADPATAAVLEAAIGEAVSVHDPQAVVSLAFDCPACAAHWRSPFDIVAFLWRWIDHAARRLLAEVDAIAGAYGWSEQQILALSPVRRRAYLGLIGA